MKVIVVGGGVAGCASAVALRRLGADVTVFEAYADPAGEIGSFVSLASNGLRGLAALGCLDRVRQRGFPVPRQRMWSAWGKLLGDVPRGRLASDDLHSVTLMRAHLVGELRAAATDAGATVVTGERLDSATPLPDGVQARFASGREERADLLIGADGIWSATRRTLAAAAPEPEYAGMYVVSGRSRGVEVEPGTFNLVFARNGAFIYVGAPDGEVWWQAQVVSATEPDRDGLDDAGWLRQASELFRERVPAEVLSATHTLHRPSINHMLGEVTVWQDRHTVLLGDAAHPVGAGQGASMAIEDAVVLARCLAGAGSIAEGLAAYERERRPRVTEMLRASDDNRRQKKAGLIRRRLEELMMPIFLPMFFAKATAWLYTYDPGEVPAVGHGPEWTPADRLSG